MVLKKKFKPRIRARIRKNKLYDTGDIGYLTGLKLHLDDNSSLSFLFSSSSSFFEQEFDPNSGLLISEFRSEFSTIGLNYSYSVNSKSIINPLILLLHE